jgi:hypothetical protein
MKKIGILIVDDGGGFDEPVKYDVNVSSSETGAKANVVFGVLSRSQGWQFKTSQGSVSLDKVQGLSQAIKDIVDDITSQD